MVQETFIPLADFWLLPADADPLFRDSSFGFLGADGTGKLTGSQFSFSGLSLLSRRVRYKSDIKGEERYHERRTRRLRNMRLLFGAVSKDKQQACDHALV